ncbi:transglycosylase domain-containing protein [Bacillus pacificus]
MREEKRTNVTYDQIPKLVENAFLATEGCTFYEHSGVDFKEYCPCCFR